MRVISLSVDGVSQAADRGLFEWLSEQDAEIICLQDLRVSEPDVVDNPRLQLDGYFCYVFDSPKPDTNGVAIYSRHAPKAIMYGFGLPCGADMDGRYLQADFDELSVGSLIAPDGADQELKQQFFKELQAHLVKITRKRRQYIFCGNWQMAHTEQDAEHPEAHQTEPGFLPEERQWLTQLYKQTGYADAFRIGNTDTDEYSWWPSGEMGQGDGLRTDLQVISSDLVNRVEYAIIYKAQVFGSHAPVIVDYDLEEF